MQLIVISDAHGRPERIEEVVARHNGADYLLYAGDTIADLENSGVSSQIEVVAVKGNRDFKVDYPKEKLIKVADKDIFLTHGDKFDIKWGLNKLFLKAKEVSADIVIFGHSHRRYKTTEQGILFFNPGSISRPRDNSPASYGIIEIKGEKVVAKHQDY